MNFIAPCSEDAQTGQAAPVCNGTWAATRSGAGNGTSFSRTITVTRAEITTCNSSPNYQGFRRTIFVMNVADGYGFIPSAAILNLTFSNKLVEIAGQSVCLVGASPADPALLVETDYATLGTDLYADAITLANLPSVDGTAFSFTLNAAGLLALRTAMLGGVPFSVGLRIESDRTDTEPTWASEVSARCEVRSQDHPTPSSRPTLDVTAGPPEINGSVTVTFTPDATETLQKPIVGDVGITFSPAAFFGQQWSLVGSVGIALTSTATFTAYGKNIVGSVGINWTISGEEEFELWRHRDQPDTTWVEDPAPGASIWIERVNPSTPWT